MITTNQAWKVTGVRVLLLAATAALPAFGAISSCSTNPTVLPLSTYLPTSPSDGCKATNLVFDNFSLGTATGGTLNGITFSASTVTNPTASNIFVTTAAAANSFAGIEFSSPGPDTGGTCTSSGGSGGW